jgi:hypothetical protein
VTQPRESRCCLPSMTPRVYIHVAGLSVKGTAMGQNDYKRVEFSPISCVFIHRGFGPQAFLGLMALIRM